MKAKTSISYRELVEKAMPPEKRKKASRCIISHNLIRPIANVVSIPLIKKDVNPTCVTMASGIFVIAAMLSFLFLKTSTGFYLGWILILVWNILDHVDGDIARYNDRCSPKGELWDASVGWGAMVVFYFGMGLEAYYDPGIFMRDIDLSGYWYLIMGFAAAMSWIFPRLVMQKKSVLSGEESIKQVKAREDYGIIKLLFFNLTSINGFAAVIFLLMYLFDLNGLCMIGYFLLSGAVAVGSLYSLLK